MPQNMASFSQTSLVHQPLSLTKANYLAKLFLAHLQLHLISFVDPISFGSIAVQPRLS